MIDSKITSEPISSISGAGIQIQQCRYTLLKRWDFPHGKAPYWRLYYFHEGKAEITWYDRKEMRNVLRTSPDRFYIIPPGTRYSGKLISTEARHLFIHFTLGSRMDTVKPRIYNPESLDMALSILNRIIETEDWTSRRGAIATELLCLLSTGLRAVPEEDWPLPVEDSRIRKIIEYMEENYGEDLNVGELADLSFMSRNGFARLFKSETGLPPVNYLNTVRLNKAADLLSHSDRSIERIAEETGYANRFYFSKRFTKHFNLSPARFRKLNRGYFA